MSTAWTPDESDDLDRLIRARRKPARLPGVLTGDEQRKILTHPLAGVDPGRSTWDGFAQQRQKRALAQRGSQEQAPPSPRGRAVSPRPNGRTWLVVITGDQRRNFPTWDEAAAFIRSQGRKVGTKYKPNPSNPTEEQA